MKIPCAQHSFKYRYYKIAEDAEELGDLISVDKTYDDLTEEEKKAIESDRGPLVCNCDKKDDE